jgi:predicted nucleic acid-binding protein
LSSADSEIVIPSIVLVEVWHLFHRKRIKTSPADVRSQILSASNCSIYPLDEAVIESLPAGLEIHDAIIIGTALVYRDIVRRSTQLITQDKAIINSGLIDIIW